MTEETEVKKANERLDDLFGSRFVCPYCKKDVGWCECEDDHPDIECKKCGSKNVEGKIRQTEYDDWEDFTCLNCGNEGSMSL